MWCRDHVVMTANTALCIPAHNEERTIGRLVETADDILRRRLRVVDEILVIDDRSNDETAAVAANAGARVVSTIEHCTDRRGPRGKGDAIRTSIAVCRSENMVWIDGDMSELDMERLVDLIRPLETDAHIRLVKGSFERRDANGRVSEGRLTALTARPLLSLYFPELSTLAEPLGGIFSMRTADARELFLEPDYGVDVGILIDVFVAHGSKAIREVPLGTLSHRSRPLCELANTAPQICRSIVSRAHRHGVGDVPYRRHWTDTARPPVARTLALQSVD
jgi:glucosyl-3-phosphoglycerate synthase